MSAAVDIDAGVRAVTDEEVRFYFDNGWVKLERLISRDFSCSDRWIIPTSPLSMVETRAMRREASAATPSGRQTEARDPESANSSQSAGS